MRLEVSTQTAISSLRKQSISLLVIPLQNSCSARGKSPPSSACTRTNWRRVSPLTQLSILPRIIDWQRQNLLMDQAEGMLLRAPARIRSTIFKDFPFFWMKERMSRMMLGITLRFYNCWDFFPFREMQVQGRQSSSRGTERTFAESLLPDEILSLGESY